MYLWNNIHIQYHKCGSKEDGEMFSQVKKVCRHFSFNVIILLLIIIIHLQTIQETKSVGQERLQSNKVLHSSVSFVGEQFICPLKAIGVCFHLLYSYFILFLDIFSYDIVPNCLLNIRQCIERRKSSNKSYHISLGNPHKKYYFCFHI